MNYIVNNQTPNQNKIKHIITPIAYAFSNKNLINSKTNLSKNSKDFYQVENILKKSFKKNQKSNIERNLKNKALLKNKDNIFEKLLKYKVIKSKEKKSFSNDISLNINNHSLLQNHISTHLLPQTSKITKFKKINYNKNEKQKNTNSILEDEKDNYYLNVSSIINSKILHKNNSFKNPNYKINERNQIIKKGIFSSCIKKNVLSSSVKGIGHFKPEIRNYKDFNIQSKTIYQSKNPFEFGFNQKKNDISCNLENHNSIRNYINFSNLNFKNKKNNELIEKIKILNSHRNGFIFQRHSLSSKDFSPSFLKEIKRNNSQEKVIFKNYIHKNPKYEIEKRNIIKEIPNDINLSIHTLSFSKQRNNNKKRKKTKENNIKKDEELSYDKDIINKENQNDSLLKYINSTLDNIQTLTTISNKNEEIKKGKLYFKDMEIISSYIKKYYKKNKKYPTTKLKFYKYGRRLGKGAYGKVNLALHILTGRLVAIKSINKKNLKNEKQKKKILSETNIMKQLFSSNYTVKILETYETEKHFCIVMEYICGGDLLNYIRKRAKLTEPIAKILFKQIILCLKYIHSHNIIHRDIKLDNILIDLDNTIKICDFGVSKKINLNEKIFEQCGTPAYIAPEILKNNGYENFSCDLWSAGIVLYAMLSGTVPFKGNNINELHESIQKGHYNIIDNISKEAQNLISNLLNVNPNKRICINDILNHPWLANLDVSNCCEYNLFTNAEKLLLSKSNIDYRFINFKNDNFEVFDLRNLDTRKEDEKINVTTKSSILAPFNSSICSKDNNNNSFDSDLMVKNNLIKFNIKLKEINRNYEFNNNGEIDNGIVISQNSQNNNNKNDLSPLNKGSFCKIKSKQILNSNELDDIFNQRKENKDEKIINESILEEIEQLGYEKEYVINCLKTNKFNYATASYYLLLKKVS